MEKTEQPKEGGHFYTKTGETAYKIEYSDPKRKGEFRPTTWKDAKKLDLVPGFSSIKNQLRSPGLDKWIMNQVLLSAFTCPLKRTDVSADEWLDRVQTDAKEQGLKAREKGTEIHAVIEKGLQSLNVPKEYEKRFLNVLKVLNKYEVEHSNIETEKSFANFFLSGSLKSYWYGGKIDILSRSKNLIADIKTTEFTMKDGKPSKKLNWTEHILQLSAYGHGVGLLDPKAINIYVSTISDDVYCHEWTLEEDMKAWHEFELLVELWWTKKGEK